MLANMLAYRLVSLVLRKVISIMYRWTNHIESVQISVNYCFYYFGFPRCNINSDLFPGCAQHCYCSDLFPLLSPV